jgi:hypothetical protein
VLDDNWLEDESQYSVTLRSRLVNTSDLANKARSLAKQGLTPTQIRNRVGFLDSNDRPCIPLETIQNWLSYGEGVAAASPSLERRATREAHSPATQQTEDHRLLHEKVARLEAQLQRLALERTSRTPSPPRSPASFPSSPGRSSSPRADQQDNSREMITQLQQMNHQLIVHIAAANQLVIAAVGAAERRDPAPLTHASADTVKPYRDCLPQVQAYSGESDRSPEAFLA